MATKYIENVGSAAGDAATELARLKAETAGNVIPLIGDAVDGFLKYYDRVNSRVRQFLTTGQGVVNCTAATLTVTEALHAGRTITLNLAAGIVVTLPAATGTGNKYRFVVGTTFTGAASIKVASGTDYMIGVATLFQDAGDTVVGFATANTGTVATESDTITLFSAGNTTGGFKGAYVEVEDIASAVFAVKYVSDAAGTEATPFSAAV